MADPADIQSLTPRGLTPEPQPTRPPGADAVDDPSLVARLRAQDPAAFELLVRETTPRMLVVARRFLTNEEDVRDVLQEAYLSAFRALPKFASESRLSTWLHRIVVNACLMRLRSRRRRPEVRIDDLQPAFDGSGHHDSTPIAWHDLPADGIERKEMLGAVRDAINQLPEDFRDVILLRDIEQVDTRVAAELLGITESAVKTRLHRARLALRGRLDAQLAQANRRQAAARAAWESPQTRVPPAADGKPGVDGTAGGAERTIGGEP
ncbi:MAG: hypothetical protein AMXMBFR58_24730 [Phycisphaerae bacterium]|nr:hypothetical protein [Phycisphaerales bacterium]